MIRLTAAALLAFGVTSAAPASQEPPPTKVVRFVVAPEDLGRAPVNGACSLPSTAAWFRDDAMACRTQTASYDPCFVTPREHVVLCVTDPRSEAGRLTLKMTSAPARQQPAARPVHRAWFFELVDGTTCRPLPGPGREVEGQVELYECKWGTEGSADAAFGELDPRTAVWAISKIKINKMQPLSFKWSASMAVKTVWQ